VAGSASAGAARPRRALDAATVALLPFVIGIQPLANNDLPMHLAIGEWILAGRTLPSRDPFSFTAGHPPWVPHEWLAELLFVLVWRSGGLLGLVLLTAVTAAAVALVHRAVAARLGVGLAAHLLWGIPMWLMAGRRIVLRPHLLALALPFAVWWCLLRARRDPRFLAPLPLLLAVWVNLHGSFPLGFAIVALDLLAFGRGHPIPWRTRLLASGASFAAFFAQVHAYFQPTLLAGVQDALGLLGDPVFMQEISEWKPPFTTARFRETFAFMVSVPWTALAALGALRRGARTPLSYRAFALVALLLYLRHSRFIDLWALASAPLLPDPADLPALARRAFARRIDRVANEGFARPRAEDPWTPAAHRSPRSPAAGSRWLAAARALTLAAALFCAGPGFPMRPGQAFRRPGLRWGYDLPFQAVDALLRRGYAGGVFCEYKFGGVVAWRGRGRLLPSMDSRNSVYGAELYRAHQEAIRRDTPFRRELLEKVGAVLILRPTLLRERRDLIDHLTRDRRWQLVHADERSLLFVKRPRPGEAPAAPPRGARLPGPDLGRRPESP
jgi:hypothetical protein